MIWGIRGVKTIEVVISDRIVGYLDKPLGNLSESRIDLLRKQNFISLGRDHDPSVVGIT